MCWRGCVHLRTHACVCVHKHVRMCVLTLTICRSSVMDVAFEIAYCRGQ